MNFRLVCGLNNQLVFMNQKNEFSEGNTKFRSFTVSDHNLKAKDVSQSVAQLFDSTEFTSQGLVNKHLNISVNVGVVVIFRTKTSLYVLGHLKRSQALVAGRPGERYEVKTKDNTVYPKQISLITEGYFGNQELSIKDGAINALEAKLFMRSYEVENVTPEEQIMYDFQNELKKMDGWQEEMCLRTQTWSDEWQSGVFTCFTAVKYIDCSDEFVEKIKLALPTYLPKVVRDRDLSGTLEFQIFDFNKLNKINESYKGLSELEKIQQAYATYGNESVVMLSDSTALCLQKTGVFNKYLV